MLPNLIARRSDGCCWTIACQARMVATGNWKRLDRFVPDCFILADRRLETVARTGSRVSARADLIPAAVGFPYCIKSQRYSGVLSNSGRVVCQTDIAG